MSSGRMVKAKQMLSKAAAAMGKRGGVARAKSISKKRISEIGRAGAMKRWYEDCRDCDGCGWYEGGKTIKTTCQQCEGRGLVRRRK